MQNRNIRKTAAQRVSQYDIDEDNIRILKAEKSSGGRVKYITFDEIRLLYADAETLKEVEITLGLSGVAVRKILEKVGIDYFADLEQRVANGDSLTIIAKENGIKLKTLAKLRCAQGLVSKRGNHSRTIDTEKLEEIYSKFGSVSGAARELGLDWKTMKKKLVNAQILDSI